MSTATKEKITLRMERIIAATPERLFALWTEPEELIKWWGPEGYTTPKHTMDVRPGGRWRTTMRYTLTNARSQPVTVDLIQSGLWGDTRIESESLKSARRSADDALWQVPVPANGEVVVTATFDTRF